LMWMWTRIQVTKMMRIHNTTIATLFWASLML
jgi:hypothetical protein